MPEQLGLTQPPPLPLLSPPPLHRAIMSYLQVICEQHRLVEQHLDKFAAPATEGGQGGGAVSKEVRQ